MSAGSEWILSAAREYQGNIFQNPDINFKIFRILASKATPKRSASLEECAQAQPFICQLRSVRTVRRTTDRRDERLGVALDAMMRSQVISRHVITRSHCNKQHHYIIFHSHQQQNALSLFSRSSIQRIIPCRASRSCLVIDWVTSDNHWYVQLEVTAVGGIVL